MKKFYITTPIYYPNARPHIGSVYSTVLADILARYARLEKKEVVFLTGLDEHGQKVMQAAEKAKMPPQSFVDHLATIFQSIFKKWHISNTIFMRTTNTSHQKAVQEWIIQLMDKGFIYKASYEGWYCISSEAFLLEKDCELKDEYGIPLSPITGKPAQWISQEAYFFKLSSFEEPLLDFFTTHSHFITPKERIEEVISFIKSGLKDLCISRLKKDLSWGIPFPHDDNHVIYVWADALNNYITAIGYLQNETEFFSCWPCDVHVMAKDIIRFHTIYWIAFLMAAELPLPKRELVHGWLLIDNEKMSKSLGNVIDPVTILEKYDVDSVRYYFATLSIKEDSNFNTNELEQKHNSDLADNLSNLLQRMLILNQKKNISSLSFEFSTLPTNHKLFLQNSLSMITEIKKEINDCNIMKITQLTMNYLNQLNAFFHHHAPWKQANEIEFNYTMQVIAYGLFQVGVILLPIMPTKMSALLDTLNITHNLRFLETITLFSSMSFQVKPSPEYLFTKYLTPQSITAVNATQLNSKTVTSEHAFPSITFDEFLKTVILVGKITKIEDIPKSDKLYYLTVDFGTEHGIKHIASGIKQYYKKEQLINTQTIFSFNLAPRSLCGVTSEGMILMTKNNENKPQLIIIEHNVPLGTRLG